MTFDLDVTRVLVELALLLSAFALATVIGWERQLVDRPAGLRTFPIVAVASCAFVLLGQRAFPGDGPSQARVIQGLMTGIGFIGGGAILKDGTRGSVRGIATAASLWNTAAIGAAVAYRSFEIAVLLTVMNYGILRLFRPERHEELVEEE